MFVLEDRQGKKERFVLVQENISHRRTGLSVLDCQNEHSEGSTTKATSSSPEPSCTAANVAMRQQFFMNNRFRMRHSIRAFPIVQHPPVLIFFCKRSLKEKDD